MYPLSSTSKPVNILLRLLPPSSRRTICLSPLSTENWRSMRELPAYCLVSGRLRKASHTLSRRMVLERFILSKVVIHTWVYVTILELFVGEYEMEDQNDPEKPVLLFKGDVVLMDEGTIVKCSTPSKARGKYYHSSRGSSINNWICGIAFGIAYMEAPKVLTDAVS